MERHLELTVQMREVEERASAVAAQAKAMRDGERPDREQLATLERELKDEEGRLDGHVKEHDARVAKCITDHTKLSDYATRLQEGASASRVQMMADCKLRHEEAERTVTAKRDGLRESMARKDQLADQIRGQERLTQQMRANLQVRESPIDLPTSPHI